MNKFKDTLHIIEEALLKPMSDDRIKEIDKDKINELVNILKKRSTLNSDGMYDVDGDVDLMLGMNLTELPMKFGKVNGDFNCSCNDLTSLEGCPQEVTRDFQCHHNHLTSLEGAPNKVGEDFMCYGNGGRFSIKDVKIVCNVKGHIYV